MVQSISKPCKFLEVNSLQHQIYKLKVKWQINNKVVVVVNKKIIVRIKNSAHSQLTLSIIFN